MLDENICDLGPGVNGVTFTAGSVPLHELTVHDKAPDTSTTDGEAESELMLYIDT